MVSVTRLAVASLFFPLLLFSAPKRAVPRATTPSGPVSSIRDVAVIDVVTGQIAPHQDIVIRGDRIRLPARRPAMSFPDCGTCTFIFGTSSPQFLLFIANAVTGVRDMGSDLQRVRHWEAEIAQRRLVGPRIYTSGPVISTAPAAADSLLPTNVVHTPAEARQIFERYYDQRVDFIKIIDLSPGAFEALKPV
jgi:hypothetical protein